MPPPSRPEDRAKSSAAAASASWAEVSLEVDSVEALLHALRGQYEQYFLGMEKRPPSKAHEQFKKRLAALRTIPSRNSALSFRIQSLQATAATYERLWMRTLHEMEDGTYRRDVFKARMRRKSSPEVPAKAAPATAEASAAVAGLKPATTGKSAAVPQTPPAQAAPPEPQIHIAGTAPPDPLAETRLRSVYRAYVEAKRKCNEDTTRLSFDAVVASLKRQVPELLERHQVRDVEYRVFVKDGKAILRAVPKI
jgi:hypothetical protein